MKSIPEPLTFDSTPVNLPVYSSEGLVKTSQFLCEEVLLSIVKCRKVFLGM